MNSAVQPRRLPADEAAQLCALLAEEEGQYRRLRRLAWRQTAYLRRQDAARLESNAREWGKYLPEADASRRRREALVREIASARGLDADRLSARGIACLAPEGAREPLRRALKRLSDTVADLYRQNGLNALLARFCLELVGEEAEIFRRAVLGDAAGLYGGDGRQALGARSCVLQHRA